MPVVWTKRWGKVGVLLFTRARTQMLWRHRNAERLWLADLNGRPKQGRKGV